MVPFSALLLATITGMTKAHSWIHCSDYRGDAAYYEPENCFGHPRPVGGRVPQMTAFGVGMGYADHPSTTCQDVTADLVSGYPLARYQQGQKVTLAWPSKNNVAATCTDMYIPDTSLELFVAAHDQDGNLDDFVKVPASFSESQQNYGFQNCPKFCEDTDKSLCTGSFFVPSDLPDGVYTFQWKLVLNRSTEAYITCFEAYVSQDAAPVPTPAPTPTGSIPPTWMFRRPQRDLQPVVDVTVCKEFFGSRAKLVKGRGASAFQATVATPCECAHFCKLFSSMSAAWEFKEKSGKCKCYASWKKVKKSTDSWAGMILYLAD